MYRNITETSIIATLAKTLLNTFQYQKKQVLNICKDSQIYKKYVILSKIVMLSFTGGFLGRISEVKEISNSTAVISGSDFLKILLNICKTWKPRLINTETSIAVDSVKEMARKLYSSPIKMISLIAVIAILTNIFLSLLIHNRDIGLLWWIARIILLFLALAGLFCNAHWPEIKQTSLILKYENKCCKREN